MKTWTSLFEKKVPLEEDYKSEFNHAIRNVAHELGNDPKKIAYFILYTLDYEVSKAKEIAFEIAKQLKEYEW